MFSSGSCPRPIHETDRILLGHGSGGKLTSALIETLIVPALANPALARLDDQAIVETATGRLAFTTDSYVVTPLFFPGGDIGELAVNGTINDLACGGAPLQQSPRVRDRRSVHGAVSQGGARRARSVRAVIEGSIPNEQINGEGYWTSFGNDERGEPITLNRWIDMLAPKAWAVVAAGTCATFGGIHAMAGNPTGCMGNRARARGLRRGLGTPLDRDSPRRPRRDRSTHAQDLSSLTEAP